MRSSRITEGFGKFKVSVCMITFNHAAFIEQAIKSVLMQEADFDFELVIGDDCSTDGTAAIVADYQKRHPAKIRAFLREKNLGMQKNSMQTHDACHGQYLALLEGDDYWTDPLKLQKQVDFLDNHRECAACFHNVLLIDDCNGDSLTLAYSGKMKSCYTFRDIIQGNFIYTASVVARNGLFGDFPKWYFDMPMGDWPYHLLNAQYGSYGYLDEVMASYRRHSGGAWSSVSYIEIVKRNIKAFTIVKRQMNCHGSNLDDNLAYWKKELVYLLNEKGDYLSAGQFAREYFVTLVRAIFRKSTREVFFLLSSVLRGESPGLWCFLRKTCHLPLQDRSAKQSGK